MYFFVFLIQTRAPTHSPLRPPPHRLPFPINVLNARPDRVASESRVIALAGLPGAITIATSMAGRGTDILLGGNPKVLTQLELEQTLVPSLTDGLYRSMSAGQPHLVTYRSTFGVLLEGLYEQEVFLRARERAEGAVGVFVGEKGVMGKEAAHELIAQVCVCLCCFCLHVVHLTHLGLAYIVYNSSHFPCTRVPSQTPHHTYPPP